MEVRTDNSLELVFNYRVAGNSNIIILNSFVHVRYLAINNFAHVTMSDIYKYVLFVQV